MPYSGGKPKDSEALSKSLSQAQRVANNFSTLYDRIKVGAPQEQIIQAQQAVAESIGGDQFQVIQMLPHFIQAAQKMVDAARVYEHFRLPGQERIVHDRRDGEKGTAEEAAKQEGPKFEMGAELEIKEGQLAAQKEKAYENYLGDRMGRLTRAMQPQHEEIEGKIERLLSRFEEMIVERFESGRQVAQESADGRARFLTKTEAQWRDFFSKFLDRMIAKRVPMEDVREFLFRGLVPRGNKGIVISDMVLSDGRVEKFIRFGVIADVLAKLKALLPGDVFGRAGVLMGEELMYLALAVSRGRDLATSPLPSAGKFIGGAAEERAAQELGIPIGGQQLQREAQQRTRGGRRTPFTGLFEEREGEPEDLPYQFIPWWHWANLKRPAATSRWATIAFYASLLALALMGIGVLTYRLLQGGL